MKTNTLSLIYTTFLFAILFLAGDVLASNPETNDTSPRFIFEIEVVKTQKAWGEGIVKIGDVFIDGGDHENAAIQHIETFCGYDIGKVLFKPILATDEQFRCTCIAGL
jgi:hypothetical protein